MCVRARARARVCVTVKGRRGQATGRRSAGGRPATGSASGTCRGAGVLGTHGMLRHVARDVRSRHRRQGMAKG